MLAKDKLWHCVCIMKRVGHWGNKMLQREKGDSSILKLETILKSRYGKGFEIKSLFDAARIQSIGGSGFALIGEELHIPLRNDDTVLGTVIVNNASDLSSDSQGDIAELVKMTLVPQLYKWHLETKESNLHALLNSQPVSIAPSTDDMQFHDDENFEVIETSLHVDQPHFVTPLIFIRSAKPQTIHKTAVQIHEYSERWAMIPFKDISDQIQAVEDLKQMGAVTLYISDITLLLSEEQKLLLNYINQKGSKDQPLLLIGTGLSNQEAMQSPLIERGLKEFISSALLDVDELQLESADLRVVVEKLFTDDSSGINLEI